MHSNCKICFKKLKLKNNIRNKILNLDYIIYMIIFNSDKHLINLEKYTYYLKNP